MVTKHTMRDFIGLENADLEARKAMMNFSYLSAIGNMDEAFKAIKLIKRLVNLKSGSAFSCIDSFWWGGRKSGSFYVSGKVPTYPSPKPTLKLLT